MFEPNPPMQHQRLDLSGLLCPMPVIRTQAAVQSLSIGDRLTVICSDPGCKEDIPAWCSVHGHHVIAVEQREGLVEITIAVSKTRATTW